MIDIKIKYQAVAFMPSMEANQSNISQMMGVFADKGLVPTTYHEVSTITLIPQLRFSLQSPNNEWNIHFGVDRIDITKNATDAIGNNIGTIEQFCADVSDFFTKILSKQVQHANRIALSSHLILKEMKEEVLNDIYLKIFNPVQTYYDHKPTEWNSRVISRIQKKINSSDEIFNFVSEINRINGQLNINQKEVSIDRIAINMDINSIPTNTINRFGAVEMTDFYKNVSTWHNELLSEILKKIK
jgi:hypothetical protein